MSNKPIFVATHPRACSTAFERVFITRRDILTCVHEPFGDAYYYGPERMGERYDKDEETRKTSGFANTTYKDVMDTLLHPADSEGKRVFVKDMAYYLCPPNHQTPTIASSLASTAADDKTTTNGTTTNGTNGSSTNGNRLTNPTVVPLPVLRNFHFAFLIRHPRRSMPSYYRCTIPPLSSKTGWDSFMPSEAGYDELRRLFDYLRQEGLVDNSSSQQQQQNGDHQNGSGNGGVKVTVVDADDLLDKPAEVIRAFCEDVGIDYHPGMLKWEDAEGQKMAVEAFEKWNGWHEDAIGSTELRARTQPKKTPTEAEEDEEWRKKYGDEAQKLIRECVNANVADYEYLKSFAIKV